ncbi:hypothetical protein G6F56_001000 [Rhizopus delemar]|nr:hypothetical protein G6F56_001000 [Rhizopus delemar]
MATGEEILNQAEQTNSERQLLELQLEGQRYKRLRSISRIKPKCKIKVCSNDSIISAGLQGTLGSRVLEVAEEVELNNWKNKCISHLPHNRIVDFSNKIQLKLIEISLKQLKSRFELKTENVVRDLDSLNKLAKKRHSNTPATLLNRWSATIKSVAFWQERARTATVVQSRADCFSFANNLIMEVTPKNQAAYGENIQDNVDQNINVMEQENDCEALESSSSATMAPLIDNNASSPALGRTMDNEMPTTP